MKRWAKELRNLWDHPSIKPLMAGVILGFIIRMPYDYVVSRTLQNPTQDPTPVAVSAPQLPALSAPQLPSEPPSVPAPQAISAPQAAAAAPPTATAVTPAAGIPPASLNEPSPLDQGPIDQKWLHAYLSMLQAAKRKYQAASPSEQARQRIAIEELMSHADVRGQALIRSSSEAKSLEGSLRQALGQH